MLARCKGAWLEDLQGKQFLDFHGNSVHQVGFGHPHVIQAIREQMETLPFCTRRYTNIPAIKLARKLTQLAPGSLDKVLFAPGGTGAVGIALKLARMATGRFKTLSMWDSFHGGSLDTISVGGEAMFRQDIGPLLPGTEHVPPPDAQHCSWDCRGTCSLKCAEYVDYVLEKEGDIGAVIAETVRSTPFIPLENARDLGDYALGRMQVMKQKHAIIGDIRGLGLLMGMELVKDGKNRERPMDLAEEVMYKALAKGLSFKLSMGNILTLTPDAAPDADQGRDGSSSGYPRHLSDGSRECQGATSRR